MKLHRSVAQTTTTWALMASAGLAAGHFGPPQGSEPLLSTAIIFSAAVLQDSDTPPAAALRYHTALLARPEPGYVFDRFCGAWLAEGSSDGLESFLTERAADGTAPDRLLLAFYFAREGRHVDAIRQFRSTLEEFPDNATAWYEKARIEAATLDFETALEDLRHAAEHADADSELAENIIKLRGRLLVRTGQPEQAAELWAALVAAHPDDETLREDLVQLWIDEGRYEEALEALAELVGRTTDPQERVARRLWQAEIQLRANRRDDAIALYTSALDDVGRGSWFEREVLSQIEAAYRRTDDLTGLRAKLDELAQASPDRIGILQHRARLLSELGETDAAIEAWQAIIDRTPGERSHRVALARLLAAEGRTDEAISRLEALLEQSPDDSGLRVQLAELRAQSGDGPGAAADMRAFVEAAGGGITAVTRAVRVLEQLDETDAALAMMREAAAAHPEGEGWHEALAEVEHRIGDRDAAIAIWRTMAADADDAEALMLASRALTSRGEVDAGFEVLEARAPEFETDARFWQAFTESALRLDRPDDAVRGAMNWVRLADDVDTGEQAVRAAARIITRYDQHQATADALDAKADQRSVGETCLLAVLKQGLGDPAAADALLAAEDQSIRILRQRAQLLSDRGAFDAAVAVLAEMLEHPDAAQAATVRDLIELCMRSGRRDDALEWVERWKTLAPGSAMPWLRQAEILVQRGDTDDAVKTLETIRRRQPDDVLISSRLAALYAESGRDTDAERVYWDLYEASEATPGRLQWVEHLATLAEWTGRRDRLIETLESRRDSNRRSAEPSLALAEAFRVLGEHENRHQALLEASRLEPRNIDLILQIANLEMQAGDSDRALASLRLAEPLDASGRVRAQIADLLVREGRLDEAIAMVSGESGALDADGLLRLADSMASMDEWEAAARFLEAQRGRFADDYRFGYMLAVAFEETGDAERARSAFLTLLEAEHERAGASTSPNAMAMQYMTGWYDILPPATVELMAVSEAEYQAYSHSSGGHWGYMYGYAGRSGSTVTLPGTLEESRVFTICHLTRLAEDLDAPARDLLADAMIDRGVRLADVLLEMPGDSWYEGAMSDELLERHAGDPAVLALPTIMSVYEMGQFDIEQYRNAAEVFKGKWPTLELLARLSIYNASTVEESDAAWDQLRATIENFEEPEPIAMMSLASVAGGLMGELPLRPLEPEHAVWLVGKLADWYKQSGPGSVYRTEAFAALISSMIALEQPQLVGSLIEAEVIAHRANPTAARSPASAMYAMGFGYQEPLGRLSMPPTELTGLPQSVLMLLSPESSMMFGDGFLDLEALHNAVGDEVDPLLGAVLAAMSGDDEAFTAQIDPMLQAEAPTLDTYLLAAAWAGQRNEAARAVELLGEASYMPMTRVMRERLDAATIAYAMETDLEGKVRDTAERSTLRLLYATQDPEVRTALIDVLDRLGLTEEAERELDRLAAQPAGQTPFSAFGGVPTGTTSIDRIVDALDDGRQDAGIRLAVNALESIGDSVLSGNTWALEDPETLSLIDLVKRRELEAAIVEQADPGEQGGAMRLVKFGTLLQLLGRDDEAEAAYERAYQARADASTALPLMNIRLGRADAAGAAALLTALPERQAMMLTQSLMSSSMMRGDENKESLYTAADMIAIHLQQTDAPADSIPPLAHQILAMLVAPMWSEGEVLPSLYTIEPEIPEGSEEQQTRRLAAHDALVAAMLAEPTLAEQAFSSRAAMAELRGENMDEVAALAREILTRPAPRTAASAQASMMAMMASQYGRYMSGDEEAETVEPRSAIDLLAERTATQDPEGIAAEIDQALRANGRTEDADQFESLRTLYGAPAEQLAAVAAEFLQGGPANPAMATDRLTTLTTALRRRESDPLVVLPAVIEHVGRAMRTPMGMQLGYASLPAYAALVTDRLGSAGAETLCEALAEELIGPPEERAQIIEDSANSNRSRGTATMRLEVFQTVVGQSLLNNPETVWVAARHLKPFARSGDTYGTMVPYAVSSAMQNALYPEEDAQKSPAESILAFLESSPMVADANEFQVFRLDHTREGTAFEQLVDALWSGRQAEAREAVLAWVEAFDQPTLGSTLLAASLRTQSPAERFEVLSQLGDQIAQLDEATKGQVLLALGGAPATEIAGLSPEASAVLAGLIGARSSVLDAAIEDVLATRVTMQGTSPWEFVEKAAEVLAEALATGRTEDAERLAEHALKELRRTQAMFGDEGAEQQLINAILENERAGAPSIAMALRLAQLSDTGMVNGDHYFNRALDRFADTLSEEQINSEERAKSASDDAPPASELRMRAALLAIEDRLDEGDAVALILPLASLIGADNAMKTANSLAEWARERAATDDALFWKDIEAAAHSAALRSDEVELATEDAARLTDYLENLAARDTAPAAARCWIIAIHLDALRDAGAPADAPASAAATLALEVLRSVPGAIDAQWVRPLLAAFTNAQDPEGWPPAGEMLDELIRASARAASAGAAYGYTESFLRSPPPFDHAQPDTRPEKTAGLLALDLAIRSDLPDHVDRLMKTPSTGLAKTTAAWAVLTSHGATEPAADAIGRNWQDAAPSFPRGVEYTEAIHQNLGALLDRFDDPAVRLYADAVFAVLPDPEPAADDTAAGDTTAVDAEPAPWPDRAARVQRVAESFRTTEFENKRLRDQTLLMLTSCETGLDAMAEELIEAGGDPPPRSDDRFGLNYGQFDATEALFLAAVRADLRRGQIGVFREGLDAYADRASQHDYESARMVGQVAQIFSNEVADRIDELSAEQLDQLAAVLGDLLSRAGIQSFLQGGWTRGSGTELSSTHAAILFAGPGPAAYDEFLAGLDANATPAQVDANQLIGRLAGMLVREDITPERRLEVLRQAMTHEKILETIDEHTYVLHTAFKKKLLSPEQLTEHGIALAEEIGDAAWMGLGFAANEAELHDFSDQVWKRAMDTQEDTAGKLHYLDHMIESERYALAIEYLDAIEPTSPGDRTKKTDLMQQAKQGLANPDAETPENPAPQPEGSDG